MWNNQGQTADGVPFYIGWISTLRIHYQTRRSCSPKQYRPSADLRSDDIGPLRGIERISKPVETAEDNTKEDYVDGI